MGTTDQVKVYTARDGVGMQAGLCLAGGIAILLFMIGLFVFSIALPNKPKDDFMPGMIGGTSVIWIGLIGRGIFLLRSVTQVMLDASGVRLQGFISRRMIPWNQIERIEFDKKSGMLGSSYRVLSLLDTRGKPIAQIPDTIGEFESLANEIASRSSAASGRTTFNADIDEQRQTAKNAKKMRWVAVMCGVLALGMGAGFIAALNEHLHERRYATEGVKVDANLVRRYMHRVTPYIQYSFKDKAGLAHSRELMMDKDSWDELVFSKTVPIEYLPSDPEWNRPLHGDASTKISGPFLWLIGVMSLVFAFFCVTSSFGLDLKSEDGIFRLTRNGRTVRQWGGTTKPTLGLHDEDAVILEEDEEPNEFVSAPQLPPPKKPTGLLVLGVFCLILGALGGGVNLLRVLVLRNVSLLATWNALDALLAIALIVVGAGLIGMRTWSRPMGLLVATLQILSSIGALVYLIFNSVQAPEVAGEDAMILTAARIGAGVGVILGAVFPIVLLVILSKRTTIDALNQT